ncbi:unnamed protein product [Lactuca virosa]|uniref:Knottins-like domain-containing protein n=1 Tax=Lactuca virosa TaxID=75947 RepID=A0AAU9PK47_9ASTR|nr:unnamed protein product [Lactuca virosa]
MVEKSLVSSVFVLLVLALSISEIASESKPPPKICEKGSKMYSGNCYSKLCDEKCKDWEKAIHGACHKRENKNTCFCYYDCDKTSPPAKDGKPPPGKDGKPPPAAGGSPPPPSDGGSPPPPAGGSPPPASGGSPPPPTAN